jgi:hypothetical protein
MKQTIILLFSVLFISCGSRKVVIEQVKKDSLSQIYTKIGTKEEVKTETKNNIITDEFTITPLDTCKDIVVNGITYKNVVLRYKNTKDNTIQVKDVKVSKIEDIKQTTEVKVKENKKDTERKSNPLLWLLIPIILYIISRSVKL